MPPSKYLQLIRVTERLYAVVLVLALTQGPMYQLWSSSAKSLSVSPRTSMPHIYFASFVAIQLPALAILVRSFNGSLIRFRSIQLFVALHAWLGFTVIWSTLARQSLPEIVALYLTSATGMFLATRFRFEEFWSIVGSAMAIGLVISLVAVTRRWDLSVDPNEGYWIGIYFNRNSLAPVAGTGVLSSVALLVASRGRDGVRHLLNIGLASGLGALSLLTLWKAESRTTPLALAGGALVLMFWLCLRAVETHISIPGLQRIGAARLTLTLTGVGVGIGLWRLMSLISLPAETSTFNSRSALWSQNWSAIQERPFIGWGWMAARHTAEFHRLGKWWTVFPTEWSHNGYHDILLGGGVVAGLIFFALLWYGIIQFDLSTLTSEAGIRFALLCFVLIAATQESFFIGSHFLWSLLTVSLFQGPGETPKRTLTD